MLHPARRQSTCDMCGGGADQLHPCILPTKLERSAPLGTQPPLLALATYCAAHLTHQAAETLANTVQDGEIERCRLQRGR